MGFTVVGSDGRRIERGVAETYARDLATRIERETGEPITVVDDDEQLVADGIDRAAQAETAVVDTVTEAPRPRRRRPA